VEVDLKARDVAAAIAKRAPASRTASPSSSASRTRSRGRRAPLAGASSSPGPRPRASRRTCAPRGPELRRAGRHHPAHGHAAPRGRGPLPEGAAPRLELHPDTWKPVVIRDPAGAREVIARNAGDKYTYRQLDDFTDLMCAHAQASRRFAKVTRSGVLPERVILEFSQSASRRTASREKARARARRPQHHLARRHRGGGDQERTVDPSGEFRPRRNRRRAGGHAKSGSPVYLRDLVNVVRTYENPPRFSTPRHRDRRRAHGRARAPSRSPSRCVGREEVADLGRPVDAARPT